MIVRSGLFVAIVLALSATSTGASQQSLRGANFWVKCFFSHSSNDDPIVYPRQPGHSHTHTFFGNESTDAFSTPATLRRSKTTCKEKADRAAYWVPTLYLNGREIKPASVGVYHFMKTSGRVVPFPAGLRMVAGDATASAPQSKKVTFWTCWMASGPFSAVPTCPKKPVGFDRRLSYLTLHVIFPECWDGKHLDSPDHRSHMAYGSYGACPRSHPVQVPGLRYLIAYPILGGRGVTLSSGGQFSGHGDFMNGWDEKTLRRIVAACTAPTAKAGCNETVSR